jgi:glyoxylase-like metal-dependent hydrolase (beta-lactamase superfamily II)
MSASNHPTDREPCGTEHTHAAAAPTIATFCLGPFETNCYVVSHPEHVEAGDRPTPCWIVDASYEPQELIEHVQERMLAPQALVLTHAHCDHMAGVPDVRRAFPGLPILIHAAEREWLNDPMLNLSALLGQPVTAPEATDLLEHNQVLKLGMNRPQAWRVIHTPGHSPGGIALFHEASLTALSGDALFAGSIGRTDFPGSDHMTLVRSIRERLYTLPPETRLFPGHGPPTTIGREMRSNPFVRA